MAGWLKPAIREHRWRGNLLPGFESQSPACRRLAGSASTRRAASLGRNAGIKCLDRERWIPHRTLRCLHNQSRMNNLQEAHSSRHPFHSQFRSGLNHTLQVCLGRRRTVGGSVFIPLHPLDDLGQLSFLFWAGSGPCSSVRCTRLPPGSLQTLPAVEHEARHGVTVEANRLRQLRRRGLDAALASSGQLGRAAHEFGRPADRENRSLGRPATPTLAPGGR